MRSQLVLGSSGGRYAHRLAEGSSHLIGRRRPPIWCLLIGSYSAVSGRGPFRL